MSSWCCSHNYRHRDNTCDHYNKGLVGVATITTSHKMYYGEEINGVIAAKWVSLQALLGGMRANRCSHNIANPTWSEYDFDGILCNKWHPNMYMSAQILSNLDFKGKVLQKPTVWWSLSIWSCRDSTPIPNLNPTMRMSISPLSVGRWGWFRVSSWRWGSDPEGVDHLGERMVGQQVQWTNCKLETKTLDVRRGMLMLLF